MKIKTSLLALAALIASTATGCSEVERTYNCAQICDKYSGCFDAELDNSDCVDKCEDAGEKDEDFAQKADRCESCLDNEGSCANQTLRCTADCAEVIAVSTAD